LRIAYAIYRERHEKLKTFSKDRFFCILSIFFSLVIFSLVFICPGAEAAEPRSSVFSALGASLHLTVSKDAGQAKHVSSVDPQRAYSAEYMSTPHVRVSLSDTMKLFFNLRPITKDYYEGRNDLNRACTTLGLDILF
jgi:hypothetical protein